MPMSEGNNASSCAASKMGGRALVVHMKGGPAVPVAPCIGAITGLMPRVFTMAFETVDVGWECLLVLPKCTTR